jgi:hypothetical protein
VLEVVDVVVEAEEEEAELVESVVLTCMMTVGKMEDG